VNKPIHLVLILFLGFYVIVSIGAKGVFENNLGAILFNKGLFANQPLSTKNLNARLVWIDQAEISFRKASERNPSEARFIHNILFTHLVRGQSFSQLGDWDRAITSYQAALIVDPRAVGTYLKLGEILTYQKPHEPEFLKPAIGYLQQAVNIAPQAGYAWLVLGHALFFDGRQTDAIEAVKEAVVWEPNAYYWTVLCEFYQHEAQWQNSVSACNQALKSEPTRADAWFHLGEALARQDNMAQAQSAWRKVVELSPGSELAQVAEHRLKEEK